MLYVAEYEDKAWIVVDAHGPEHVVEILNTLQLETPKQLREVPIGTFVCELFADDDDSQCEAYAERDEVPNPANHSQVGLALEPLEPTADWLRAQLEDAELAETDRVSAAPEAPAPPADETSETP